MSDRGGWRSRRVKAVQCPKCPNDDASMIETELYGKRRSLGCYCRICAHTWIERVEGEGEGST